MKKMNGMVALLTGGSRGIGPLIAEVIVKRGASIILAARSRDELDDIAKQL